MKKLLSTFLLLFLSISAFSHSHDKGSPSSGETMTEERTPDSESTDVEEPVEEGTGE